MFSAGLDFTFNLPLCSAVSATTISPESTSLRLGVMWQPKHNWPYGQVMADGDHLRMLVSMKERASIPEPTKRAVRQACGFGCVLCGYPIYDYDHIVPYAIAKEHSVENLCLLCGQHHAEKNRGLLPVEKVRQARLDPINKRTGVSEAQYIHYSGNRCVVRLGNYIATNDLPYMEGSYCALVIANEKLIEFRIEDSHLLLSLAIKDADNQILLLIIDNELIYKTDLWDLSFIGGRITIKDKQGSILAELALKPPNEIIIERAIFWNKSYCITVSSKGISDRYGNTTSGARSHNVKYGVVLNSRDEFWPSLAYYLSY